MLLKQKGKMKGMEKEMKKSGWKRIAAWLLIGVMLILTGCSGQTENDTAQTSDRGEAASSDKKKIMGRYVEEEITLPPEVTASGDYPRAVLQVLDGGELAVLEEMAGLYVSEDGGELWEKKETPWLSGLEEAYISHMAIAPDGAVAVIYSDPAEESEDVIYSPKYLYADAEGTEHEIPYTDTGDYLNQLWFGRDSRLYGYSIEGNVYEINSENGTVQKLFETEGLANYVCFTETCMIVIASRGVTVYNMEEGRAQEDEVLQSFIMEKTGGAIGSNTDSYLVAAAAGEEPDVLYLALEKGIYRHVIGGTAMEQVADGSINSLGDPQMSLQGFAVLANNEFAVLYDMARLYRYVYDASVPAVPEEQLSIYSLEEDYTIRQAVSLFQKQNPEVYIRYEVGMTGDDGMTAEDAIKNLNTKIMSGNGPDLLSLNGLPAESYKQKGILADLTAIEESMTGDESLFPNLVDAFREDGKLYSIPVRFRIPLIAGEKSMIEGISDLSALADAVEGLRKENPTGPVTGLMMEEQVLYTLGLSSSAAWLNEKGEIDQEALTDFLTQAKRIYQAEIAGYDETELEEQIEQNTNLAWQNTELVWERYDASVSAKALSIAMGSQKLGLGTVHGMDADFNMLSTLENQEDGFGYRLWQGQTSKGFLPATCLAISSGSMENELAVSFFRFFFSQKLQDLELPAGFPINQSSFEKLKENPRGNDDMTGICIVDGSSDDDIFSLDISWASEEQFQWLKTIVESLNNACISDSMIEKTVYEIGPKALNGASGVEDTVAEIVKKAAIYLAE